jgi:hypothetical protein
MKAYYQILDSDFPVKMEISLEEYYDKLKEEELKFNDIFKTFMLEAMDKRRVTKEEYHAKLIETIKQVPKFETRFRKFWLE